MYFARTSFLYLTDFHGKITRTGIAEHSLGFNYEAYANKIAQLEQVFENLGAKLYKRVDLPYLENLSKGGRLHSKHYKKIKKIKRNSICIIKKYGKGYKTDVWSFPELSLGIYPFYTDYKEGKKHKKNMDLSYLFNRIIEIKGSNSVLHAVSLDITHEYELMSSLSSRGSYYPNWIHHRELFSPCLSFLFHRTYNKKKISIGNTHTYVNSIDISMPIDTIGDIKSMSIELEEI